MSEQMQIVATHLLRLTVATQKPERTMTSLVGTMVEKYGERGFVVAPDEQLHELFVRLYESPESVTPEVGGALCLAIMTRGLKHQLTQGWSAAEIETFALRDYASRLAPAVSEAQLRDFVKHALGD